MESKPSQRIEFTLPSERKATTISITSEMYLEGRLYSSQIWATKDEAKRAKKLIAYGENTYGNPNPIVYTFQDEEGRDCILVGDGHHRVGYAIVEGIPLTAEVDAKLGVIEQEMLQNPKKTAQRFAVLGIEGIYPFKSFMNSFIEIRVNGNGK